VDYRFVTPTKISTTVPWGPSDGYDAIELRRVTSATERLVNFNDGSILRSYDLNISQIQAIHIAEEGRDVSNQALQNNLVRWDALGLPLSNLGAPVEGTDATNVDYVLNQVDSVTAYINAQVDQLMTDYNGQFTGVKADYNGKINNLTSTVNSNFSRTLRAPTADNLAELPIAIARANKMLAFNDLGQPIAVIPQSGAIGDFAIDLANTLSPTRGAGMVGYLGRSVFDRLSEVVYFKDAPFYGKMDGSDDSAAWLRFIAYLKVHGGRGMLGKGKLYLKSARLYLRMSEGAFKSFDICGEGPGTTHISFGDISPELNGAGAITKNEPNLFDVSGVIGLQSAPRIRLKDFSFDYIEQVYKGGASKETPALTDIKPLSGGVFTFLFEYTDGVEIDNVVGAEVYGNGVILSRSPYSSINNFRAYNISGGNPGAADSTGGLIGIMRGSQVGTHVSHCVGINTRTFKTDTVGGFNNITAKDTLCGYIGVWTEYGIDVGGKYAPGTDLWGTVTPTNSASMGCLVENCLVYGYTLGFKMEGNTPCVFDSCVAINCWIPYIGGASQGRITNPYADPAGCDGKQCPQSGYEYVRALFVHYNVNGPAWMYSGFTFDGCMGITRKTRVNTTNCDDGRFTNQQIVIDHTGTGGDINLLATRKLGAMRGAKVSGIYIIRGLGENKSAIIYDMASMELDITVINMTDKLFTINPAQFYVSLGYGCANSKINVDSVGLVRLAVSASPDVVVNHTHTLLDTALQAPGNLLSVGGCTNAVVSYDHTLHSSAIAPGQFAPVEVSCVSPVVKGVLRMKSSGVNTMDNMLFTNSVQPNLSLYKYGDTAAMPLIKPGTSAKGAHINAVDTGGDASPLFDIGYGFIGPITLNDGLISARKLTLQTLTFEPNHPDRIAKDTIEYMPGVSFKYLRPVAGALWGCKAYTGGRRATAWVASTAVSLNTYRAGGADVYKATVAGTTGTVIPSHTSGDAVDGTVTWTWVAPKALFVESTAAWGTTLI
jgi:hypothetical protein